MPFTLTRLRCNIADDAQEFDEPEDLLAEVKDLLEAGIDESDEIQIGFREETEDTGE